ncbi:hypothetical protein AAE250_20575 [Bacteroides sp. GD17]|jgi:predicted lactoylglutathione lyase|uniref:hypothetical protein n=1 Tax=Bacteroides sp. GD17 TaxID=3139826 RepID=UPI0025DB8644|nr:hypothetical protein [uncultured Bacteroides sp.]
MDKDEYMKFLEDTVKELISDLEAATDCLAALSIRRKREMDDLMRHIDDAISNSKITLNKVEGVLP